MRLTVILIAVMMVTSFTPDNEPEIRLVNAPLLTDGGVKGKIILPRKALRKVLRKRRSRRYGRSVLSQARRAKKYTEYQKSLVYLVPLDPKNDRPIKTTEILAQENVSFQPAVIGLQKGAKVNILNKDNIFHNVFSNDAVKRFNIGKVRKNEDRLIEFNSEGTIQVFCDIHAFMSAYIKVVDTPYYTVADEDGDFEILNIPPGRYRLFGWHARSEYGPTIVDVRGGQYSVVGNMEFN